MARGTSSGERGLEQSHPHGLRRSRLNRRLGLGLPASGLGPPRGTPAHSALTRCPHWVSLSPRFRSPRPSALEFSEIWSLWTHTHPIHQPPPLDAGCQAAQALPELRGGSRGGAGRAGTPACINQHTEHSAPDNPMVPSPPHPPFSKPRPALILQGRGTGCQCLKITQDSRAEPGPVGEPWEQEISSLDESPDS